MEPFNSIPDDKASVASDADSGNAGSGDDNDLISVQENQNIGDKDCPCVENGMSDFVPRKQYQQVLDKIQAFEQKLAFMDGFMQRISQEKGSSQYRPAENTDHDSDKLHGQDRETPKDYALQLELLDQKYKKRMLLMLSTQRKKYEKELMSLLIEKGEALNLRYLDWESFLSIDINFDSISYPIHVLVGEPEVEIWIQEIWGLAE
ncbi:hypothetical protein DID88_000418 [Monilinia fructigena]|uniref:Uncharacterized protein n=1 Tax=Monilinia fructigena TaxID=38457 RepID=A0A395IN31_9HELO|nr:hypothetical protein DID88_000418 [Monilinia fructigena]